MKELIDIQSELKAPKSQYNSFGKYKYRKAEDILEALKPLLKQNGCILTLTDDISEVAGRIYVKAIATITNSEGASVSATAFARESETKSGMDAAQITGAASSYARKYALNGLFCIDDSADPDSIINLDDVIAKAKTLTTYDELKALWDAHQDIDVDKKLSKTISARRKELGV